MVIMLLNVLDFMGNALHKEESKWLVVVDPKAQSQKRIQQP